MPPLFHMPLAIIYLRWHITPLLILYTLRLIHMLIRHCYYIITMLTLILLCRHIVALLLLEAYCYAITLIAAMRYYAIVATYIIIDYVDFTPLITALYCYSFAALRHTAAITPFYATLDIFATLFDCRELHTTILHIAPHCCHCIFPSPPHYYSTLRHIITYYFATVRRAWYSIWRWCHISLFFLHLRLLRHIYYSIISWHTRCCHYILLRLLPYI